MEQQETIWKREANRDEKNGDVAGDDEHLVKNKS